ncbi:hypothetical protein MTR67_031364 [Solanum verrucosum]|uniref:Uncharacterized protein n=1 Tax=Solanum verrucosum TaxID=315347 RepID=A0AAF0U2C8_SOLVR|nr:hypothetical protein MTR67_031364 [Solanum verrucosum]
MKEMQIFRTCRYHRWRPNHGPWSRPQTVGRVRRLAIQISQVHHDLRSDLRTVDGTTVCGPGSMNRCPQTKPMMPNDALPGRTIV